MSRPCGRTMLLLRQCNTGAPNLTIVGPLVEIYRREARRSPLRALATLATGDDLYKLPSVDRLGEARWRRLGHPGNVNLQNSPQSGRK